MKSAVCLLASVLLVFNNTTLADDFEKYAQEHFNDLYQKLNEINFQATNIIEFRRELEELRNENRFLRDQLENLNRKLNLIEERDKDKSPAQVPQDSQSTINQTSINSAQSNANADTENDRRSLAQAKVLLRNKQNEQAILTLEPLTISKNQSVAQEAQYWLGISYVAQGQCNRARPYLQSFYNSAVNHEFSPEAMLAHSICERDSGNQKLYQDIITKIKTLYPNSRAAKSLP